MILVDDKYRYVIIQRMILSLTTQKNDCKKDITSFNQTRPGTILIN